jgi:1-acyl-sn-glycerol-3-phosphate acyltransferase
MHPVPSFGSTTPRPLQLLRFLRIALHFAQGIATAAIVFPLCSPSRRDALIRSWARKVIAILGVRVRVHGMGAQARVAGAVFVANHISWLDVWLIDSQRACRFVAKSEVRDWPIVGWLAEKSGTLFVQRARRHHTAALNQQIAHALAEGGCVAMFPEGTTTDGRQVKRFYTSLLQPAADAGAPLIPVAIRYVRADGVIDLTPAFIDDMTLPESVRRMLGSRETFAELTFLAPINTQGKTRRDIAHAAQDAIATALNLPSPGTTPETEPDPPGA